MSPAPFQAGELVPLTLTVRPAGQVTGETAVTPRALPELGICLDLPDCRNEGPRHSLPVAGLIPMVARELARHTRSLTYFSLVNGYDRPSAQWGPLLHFRGG